MVIHGIVYATHFNLLLRHFNFASIHHWHYIILGNELHLSSISTKKKIYRTLLIRTKQKPKLLFIILKYDS